MKRPTASEKSRAFSLALVLACGCGYAQSGAEFGPHMALSLGADGRPTGRWPSLEAARGPSFEVALQAAKAAAASCKGIHVGVTILDSDGMPKLYYIPDGVAGMHAYIAHLKANTALVFKMPSENAAELAKADPAAAKKWAAGKGTYSEWAGGVPIAVGSDVIGAIGVSGAEPSSKDKACAMDGLKAVKDQLK